MEPDLRQFVRAALRWSWLILLSTLALGAAAYVLTSGQTATYSATTTILVNPQQVSGTTENAVLQASRSQAETFVRLVESGPVLDRVIDDLDLAYSRGELAEKIEAQVIMDTQLIEVSVSDPSAEDAARIANSVATQFEAQVEELTIGRLQENLAQLREEASSLEARQAEIDAELAELDTEGNADEAAIEELRTERVRTQETLADIDASIRSINSSLATTTSPVEVADEASAAREPDSPRPKLMTALGLFLGLLVGVGVAAVFEFTDKKIRPETDVEELTESRLLTTIPEPRRAPSGQPFVVSQSDSASSEAIRKLRTRLGVVANTESHNAIVFAGAGGTSLSSEIVASLGVVMAQAGLRTVVVDANFRHPQQHTIFGIANDDGLASALSSVEGEPRRIDATIVAPRLSVVSAGTVNGHPGEMLSSPAFASLLGTICQEANVVLIDAPPALDASDALSMAAVADGVVFVARYGSTTRDNLEQLAETMHQDGIRLIGVVMSRK
jgi:capsular polysaccharide biosynthesis protein/Mrp family chromosome partitioning ATPase